MLSQLAKHYNILLARIRIPLDDRPHPKNILTKLINFRRIIDIPNSVTYIPDFIKALKHLIKIDARGIYNVVCKGGLRYPALLREYQKYRPDFCYHAINVKELKLRRTNLVLSTAKLEKTGFHVRDISQVVEQCARNYIKF